MLHPLVKIDYNIGIFDWWGGGGGGRKTDHGIGIESNMIMTYPKTRSNNSYLRKLDSELMLNLYLNLH